MEIAVTDPSAQLSELIRRAEAGDEVVLTRHGLPVARIVPLKKPLTPEARRAVIEEVRASARLRVIPGPSPAELQASLYDENGSPQ